MLTRAWIVAAAAPGVVACSSTPSNAPPDSGPGTTDGAACPVGDAANEVVAAEAGGAAPVLAGLGVVPGGRASSALVPAFAPDVYDYYVKCGAGSNPWTVTATARTGQTASLAVESSGGSQTPSGSPAATKKADMTLEEGQAVVAAAVSGKASAEYWVRCLPHDMSPMQWVTYSGACSRPPGYYLVGDQAVIPPAAAYVIVLDRNGVPVWYQRPPTTPPYESKSAVFDFDSLSDGTLSYLPWPSVMALGPFQREQLMPLTTTPIHATGWALDVHELRALGGGHYLVFSDEVQTGVDLTGYNVPESDGGVQTFGKGSRIIPCDILEVDDAGHLLWKWIGTDHLDPVKDNQHPGLDTAPTGTLLPDPFHCNSIDVDPANGNLLVSSRHMNSVFYVERPSGKILWKMGGVKETKDSAAFIPIADPFLLQHDARLLPGWSTCGGQLSVFDDQSYTSNPARAVIYDVQTGLPGRKPACATAGATVSWQRAGDVASNAMGSFRILPDGSRIIGWGTRVTERGPAFTEVDAMGTALVELRFTNDSQSYRAVKVPLSGLDLGALRRTAGLP